MRDKLDQIFMFKKKMLAALIRNLTLGASERAQLVKGLASQSDDLSSIPRTYIVGKEKTKSPPTHTHPHIK